MDVRRIAFGLTLVMLVLGVVAGVLVVRFDHRVRAYLAGPALGTTRIYSAPTVLRSGAAVPGGSLARTLARLGYQAADDAAPDAPLAPGTYRAAGAAILTLAPRPSPMPGAVAEPSVRVTTSK